MPRGRKRKNVFVPIPWIPNSSSEDEHQPMVVHDDIHVGPEAEVHHGPPLARHVVGGLGAEAEVHHGPPLARHVGGLGPPLGAVEVIAPDDDNDDYMEEDFHITGKIIYNIFHVLYCII